MARSALEPAWPRRRLARDLALVVLVKFAALAAMGLVWFSDPPPVSTSVAQQAVFGETHGQPQARKR